MILDNSVDKIKLLQAMGEDADGRHNHPPGYDAFVERYSICHSRLVKVVTEKRYHGSTAYTKGKRDDSTDWAGCELQYWFC